MRCVALFVHVCDAVANLERDLMVVQQDHFHQRERQDGRQRRIIHAQYDHLADCESHIFFTVQQGNVQKNGWAGWLSDTRTICPTVTFAPIVSGTPSSLCSTQPSWILLRQKVRHPPAQGIMRTDAPGMCTTSMRVLGSGTRFQSASKNRPVDETDM